MVRFELCEVLAKFSLAIVVHLEPCCFIQGVDASATLETLLAPPQDNRARKKNRNEGPAIMAFSLSRLRGPCGLVRRESCFFFFFFQKFQGPKIKTRCSGFHIITLPLILNKRAAERIIADFMENLVKH